MVWEKEVFSGNITGENVVKLFLKLLMDDISKHSTSESIDQKRNGT